MIDTTARRDRRALASRTRLDRLARQARGDLPPAPLEELSPEDLLDDLPMPDVPLNRADRPATARSPGEHELGALADRLGPRDPGPEPRWRRGLNSLLERWLPAHRSGPPRWRLAVLAFGGVVVGIAVALGVALSGGPEEREAPPDLPAAAVSETGLPGGGVTPAAADSIVVSVVGKVVRPGLVTVPAGARVADALAAAGGPVPRADLGALNLARRLADGEQIYIGVPAPAHVSPAGPEAAGQEPAGQVDLNSASVAALDTLPGVGPVTAQRIVDWRTQHGRFDSVEQLRDVEGIGPSRFGKLKDLVVAW